MFKAVFFNYFFEVEPFAEIFGALVNSRPKAESGEGAPPHQLRVWGALLNQWCKLSFKHHAVQHWNVHVCCCAMLRVEK